MNIKRFVFYHPRAMVGDGGVTNAIWSWCDELEKAGHSTAVLFDSRLNADRQNGATETIAVRHVGRAPIMTATGLRNHLREGDVLILQSSFGGYNYAAAVQARSLGIPWIVAPHSALAPECLARHSKRKRVFLPAEKWLLKHSLGVHVFFNPEREHIHNVAPSARVIVAPTAFVRPTERWNGGTDLVWLGRYDVRQKGLDLLLDAVAQISPEERPFISLRGRRSKNSANEVRAMAKERGVADFVTVGASIDNSAEKWEFLSNSAAFIQPSRWEANSVALLEALAIGTPCLVTTTCPIKDLLIENSAGIVVEPNPQNIADGLRQLTQRSEELSSNTAQLFERDLAWSSVIPSFVEQVQNCADQQSSSTPVKATHDSSKRS